MPQFKVIKKAYGSKKPGAPQELLLVGDIVEADTCPGSAYEALDGGAQVASPAVVSSAKKRAAVAAHDKD